MDPDPASPLPPPLAPPLEPPVRVRLHQLEAHACPYLPGRVAKSRGLAAGRVSPEIYEGFLNRGFRRSGRVIYQPNCDGCRACMPLRIDVGAFVASASQRRTARRNADLTLGVGAPNFTSEKLGLYQRYVEQQHGPPSEVATAESLTEFLYSSPVESMEVEYRDSSAKLIGVGICDLTGEILSSVYFFWDPSEGRRSLGVFAVLSEIALARELGKRWYHLGYWIENSATMHYKGSLSRHALLGPDGRWVERERLGLL